MTAHETIKSNWLLFQSGKITLPELLARNNRVCLSSEVEVVKVSTPPAVQKAREIFAPHSEKGCPVEKEDERWNS